MDVNPQGSRMFFWSQICNQCHQLSFLLGDPVILRKLQNWGATKNQELNSGVKKSCRAFQPSLEDIIRIRPTAPPERRARS